MTDTVTNGEPAKKAKRPARSRRDWIDADGNVVEDIKDATGFGFTLLNEDGTDAYRATRQFPTTRTNLDFGFWAMGGQTKLGNIGNTVLNEKDGTTAEAAEAMTEFLSDPEK